MKKIITIVPIVFFMLTLFVSCGTGGLDGTYVAKNDAAKQSMYTKFIFKGGRVKVVMGAMGIEMPGGYEYGFSREGDKVKIEMSVGGISMGGIDLNYNEKTDELRLLFGGEVGTALNEYAPTWGKEGTFDPNNPYPEKQKPTVNTLGGKDTSSYSDNKENKDSNKPITGTFEYSGGDIAQNKVDDYETDFVFSTKYFNNSASEYNHDLAIMSLQLAMAAFGLHSETYGNNKANNVKKLLSDMDLKNIEPKGYNTPPEENTIAVTFARKSIENDYELLVIAVRGGEYKKEWGGNFNVGNGDVHKGFEIAKEKIINDYFDEYIRTHINEFSGKKVKLWITGYSRGAAVANLLAVDFVDEANFDNSYDIHLSTGQILSFSLERKDIYAYCFATPNNSKKAKPNDDNYNNIISVISPFDPVPRFPFQSWNFYKYGTCKFLPNPNSTTYDYKALEQKMLTELNGLNSKGSSKKNSFNESGYFIDDFHFHQGNTGTHDCGKNIYDVGRHPKTQKNMVQYLDNMVNSTLRAVFGKQEDYAKNKQADAINGAMEENKDNSGDVKGFMGALTGALKSGGMERLATPNNNDDIATLGPSKNHLEKLRLGDDNVCHIEESERTPALYRFDEGWSILGRAYDDKTKEIQEKEGITKKEARKKAVLEAAEEARKNSYAVTSGHYPELYLAWLKSLPSDWTKRY
ncbi:MAG: hypothetical protein LBI82_07545 [Dysgonamonadaceae bacterium]|jgi:hypothetical protein|nr:hypothetical protein [Dysgonamonadaceae bacterium]